MFYLKTDTNRAFDKSLKAPAVQPKVASAWPDFFIQSKGFLVF